MDTVKKTTFRAIFQLDRIYAYDALLVDTECADNFSAYFSLIRPCGASSFMVTPAFGKFPAFHLLSPSPQVSINPGSVNGF